MEITTHGHKRNIDKPRPNGGRFSFPSGHSAAAFYGATFLNQRFGLKVGVPSYLIASYVRYTRIKANMTFMM